MKKDNSQWFKPNKNEIYKKNYISDQIIVEKNDSEEIETDRRTAQQQESVNKKKQEDGDYVKKRNKI